MWFLWGMSSQMFPLHPTPRPASPWIQLRPNDTSAAIITYSLTADRRKRRGSVLSTPAPTHRNKPPTQDTAGLPSLRPFCAQIARAPRPRQEDCEQIYSLVNAPFLLLMAPVISGQVQLRSDIKYGDSQNSRKLRGDACLWERRRPRQCQSSTFLIWVMPCRRLNSFKMQVWSPITTYSPSSLYFGSSVTRPIWGGGGVEKMCSVIKVCQVRCD